MSLAAVLSFPVDAAQRGLLRADTVGSRVPREDRGGRVEAVFENACNVLLDSGQLITVLARRAGNVAHGVRLLRDLRFDHCLRHGMPVLVGRDRIDIDRKSTRLNSSHIQKSRMPSSA